MTHIELQKEKAAKKKKRKDRDEDEDYKKPTKKSKNQFFDEVKEEEPIVVEQFTRPQSQENILSSPTPQVVENPFVAFFSAQSNVAPSSPGNFQLTPPSDIKTPVHSQPTGSQGGSQRYLILNFSQEHASLSQSTTNAIMGYSNDSESNSEEYSTFEQEIMREATRRSDDHGINTLYCSSQ
jgi:hypothetical protein